MRAMSPNSVIIVPEILFTHFSRSGLNFEWNKPTIPVRMSHHRIEPMNTPRTSITGLLWFPFVPSVTPSPANTAAKERIVKGLASVSKNVEA